MPKVQDIISNSDRYRLILVLYHQDIIQFVRHYYYGNTPSVTFFKRFMTLCFFGFLIKVIFLLYQDIFLWDELLMFFGFGVLSFSLLVPIHELIHGAVYKWVGAPTVKFGVMWRKLAFFAIAPDFVANRKQFIPVAWAPFLVINSTLFVLIFLWWGSPLWQIAAWGALLMHSMGCIGDFALMGFFEEHKHLKIYTFDRKGEAASYFYEEIE